MNLVILLFTQGKNNCDTRREPDYKGGGGKRRRMGEGAGANSKVLCFSNFYLATAGSLDSPRGGRESTSVPGRSDGGRVDGVRGEADSC